MEYLIPGAEVMVLSTGALATVVMIQDHDVVITGPANLLQIIDARGVIPVIPTTHNNGA